MNAIIAGLQNTSRKKMGETEKYILQENNIMDIKKRMIEIGGYIFYPLMFLGLIDFILQIMTGFEFRLIHRILSSMFWD